MYQYQIIKQMKYLKIISIAIVEFLFVLPCSAYDFEADGIFYNILSGKTNEVEVTRGSSYLEGYYNNSYSGDVIIPASISHLGVTYNVTSIGERAFKDSKEVTSVSMPNTIEIIKSDNSGVGKSTQIKIDIEKCGKKYV